MSSSLSSHPSVRKELIMAWNQGGWKRRHGYRSSAVRNTSLFAFVKKEDKGLKKQVIKGTYLSELSNTEFEFNYFFRLTNTCIILMCGAFNPKTKQMFVAPIVFGDYNICQDQDIEHHIREIMKPTFHDSYGFYQVSFTVVKPLHFDTLLQKAREVSLFQGGIKKEPNLNIGVSNAKVTYTIDPLNSYVRFDLSFTNKDLWYRTLKNDLIKLIQDLFEYFSFFKNFSDSALGRFFQIHSLEKSCFKYSGGLKQIPLKHFNFWKTCVACSNHSNPVVSPSDSGIFIRFKSSFHTQRITSFLKIQNDNYYFTGISFETDRQLDQLVYVLKLTQAYDVAVSEMSKILLVGV